ncbi:hypothetical protein BXZ70DRAFT_943029 [Cristinia sonorae]|uniref:Uncharacterized protein n=1 Tax=Cristinia sonorae TaxID=1940300 RepID=A0A8K0XNP5_9AGAR|nr:hypothetical protein BXZ70DRAFT_943029 [Cristinia sonorae]
MADAGPSNPTSTSHNAVTPPSSLSKASSRVQFPQDYDHASADGSRKSMSTQMAALGLGRPPVARTSTSRSNTYGERSSSRGQHSDDTRPRVKSVDAPIPSPGPSRPRFTAEAGTSQPRRATPPAHRLSTKRGKSRVGFPEPEVDIDTSYVSKTFSDEYDLANEDPRILEDVQRAIRMKARREARSKQPHQQVGTERKVTTVSDIASGSSLSPQSSPKRMTIPTSSQLMDSAEPEIDFSPSIRTVPLHPVPSSTNGGATLDWTIPGLEDEKHDRRWRTLSIMRKPKEKLAVPSNKEVVEKQESLYTDKLAQIRAKVQPVTFRKAAITKDQLERQYAALLGTINTAPVPPNILGAARWYASQDEARRTALDRTEPLTWLKHLDKSRRTLARFPWHVTAHILEEYLTIKHRPDAMETIPEYGVVDNLILKHSPGSLVQSGEKSPSSGSWSWTPPTQSIEPSLSRKPWSSDAPVSFEPVLDSGRDSIGDESRISDNIISHWMHSRAGGSTSPRNSTQSSLFYSGWPNGNGTSPNNSRLNFKDFAQRIRRKPYGGSEDGLSSARNSISEQSQEEDRSVFHKRTSSKARARHTSLQLLSRSAPPTDDEKASKELDVATAHSDGDAPPTAKPMLSAQLSPGIEKIGRQVSPRQRAAAPRFATRRVSLPSYNQFFIKQAEQRRQADDEEQERLEYERKLRMLEDTMAQNHNTRQILQRISHHMKEYYNVQHALSELVGVAQPRLPQDVLEAFNHDPAAVIGSTKRFKGAKAVEDIHERIIRQQHTIRSYIASISNRSEPGPARNIFEEPIASLMASLTQLEADKSTIAREAENVVDALQRVKGVHSAVKKEYNETLSHTSLIYPELSQIITLEENYRNHYQQLWNIGLDALTLLLDTVTPFWRNYGKVIGEDMQDFLIVPWYRNEFTGEVNWYPIKSFPKRSLRHWIGLLLFSCMSVVVLMLQLRAALSSTFFLYIPWLADSGLRWLVFPFFLVALMLQWIAVVFELFLILAEAGIVIWWLGWSIRIFV